MNPQKNTAILLVSCPDARGIVAALSAFLAGHRGNIVEVDQYVDAEESRFFARIEWQLDGFTLPMETFADAFRPVAAPLDMHWHLYLPSRPMRMGILVSKQSHCLHDILARRESGEWNVDIPVILSNHEDLRPAAERQGIPFRCIPVPKEGPGRDEAFAAQTQALRDAGCDFVVLARYMQILPPACIEAFPMRILNIHHSFLPAFVGARPYDAAHARGVKIIGATAHYVTEQLDQGPIIEQDVTRITHRQGVADLIRLGRDLEKIVLARAIWLHLAHRILVHQNRTIVFN